jgi:hypothetical protein
MDNSIAFFTMHRSASTFQIDMLKELATLSGKRHVHIDPRLENRKENRTNPIRVIPERFESMFSPTAGHIYGPFRRFAQIPEIEKYRIILSLRDPRDVVVSLFFSQVYSHGPPPNPELRKQYIARTHKAKEQGIDRFCLQAADNMVRIYSIYKEAYEKMPMLLLTYEEMVQNFPSYAKKMLEWCDLQEHHRIIVRKFNKFKAPKEDIYAHKRQVTPGDHKRKLKRPTINQITRKLKPILGWLYGT